MESSQSFPTSRWMLKSHCWTYGGCVLYFMLSMEPKEGKGAFALNTKGNGSPPGWPR